MTQLSEPARISLIAGSGASTCELCTEQRFVPAATVVISHTRGGVVQLAACDWCVRAIRRLAATSGGQAVFAMSEIASPPPSAIRPIASPPQPIREVLIRELADELLDSAGSTYMVRVRGRERSDATWEGFLEFVNLSTGALLQTGIETTQSKREDLAYWASGLNTGYLQGAFTRATPVS
jgi:hypothetical protein